MRRWPGTRAGPSPCATARSSATRPILPVAAEVPAQSHRSPRTQHIGSPVQSGRIRSVKRLLFWLVVGAVIVGARHRRLQLFLRDRNPATPAASIEPWRWGAETSSSSVPSTGTVQPVQSVQVGAFVSGPIKTVHVDFNAKVTEGATPGGDRSAALQGPAQIRPRPSLDCANANLLQAEAKLQTGRRRTGNGPRAFTPRRPSRIPTTTWPRPRTKRPRPPWRLPRRRSSRTRPPWTWRIPTSNTRYQVAGGRRGDRPQSRFGADDGLAVSDARRCSWWPPTWTRRILRLRLGRRGRHRHDSRARSRASSR